MKNYLLYVAALLLFSGCSDDDGQTGSSIAGPVILNSSFSMDASCESPNESFAEGDAFSLFAYLTEATVAPQRTVDNVRCSLSADNVWMPAEELHWQVAGANHRFVGIYPAIEGKELALDALPFVADGGVVMIASVDARPKQADQVISLPFKHLLGCLNVEVVLANEFPVGEVEAALLLKGWNKAVLNAQEGAFVVEEVEAEIEVPLHRVEETYVFAASYALLPQKFTAEHIGLRLLVDGEEQTYTVKGVELVEVLQGQVTAAKLRVGESSLVVEGTEITDWTPGNPGDGGIHQTDTPETTLVVGGADMGSDWAEGDQGDGYIHQTKMTEGTLDNTENQTE